MSRHRRKIRKQIEAACHNPPEQRAGHQTSKLLKLLDSIKPSIEKPNRELAEK
ncbi:MAG: hypothetical protein WCO57_08115 [Verrucomicrobiota bacterium]